MIYAKCKVIFLNNLVIKLEYLQLINVNSLNKIN